ncbi:MAG: UvrB/UvrC motif-containing protein [Phycisphaerales bacterium]|nr:UvrB/UvrC motif-containing protein [Phycisphaerales bacterium]
MNVDLTELLQGWPHEPGKINVRLIQGLDGEQKVQIRLDLGILQMNVDGRPDGQRPEGFDSLLEYYEAKLDDASREGEEGEEEEGDPAGGPGVAEFAEPPTAAGETTFRLSPDDCRALREEAVQYYHRYVALLVLEDYDRVVRDTSRNLRLLDLCAEHAEAEDDRTVLEQFRPYITMMRARALASQALRDNEPKAALHAIDDGIESLRRYFADFGNLDLFEASNEVQMLRGMRDSLVPKLPVSQKTELRQRLQRAIEAENYELAAILRDELRMLPE